MEPRNASADTRQIWVYFGILTLTLGLAEPTGLLSLPLLFWLKDGLHLSAQPVAVFEAIVLIPAYFGFAFGFLRDRWRPFGHGDRMFLAAAALLAIAGYYWLAAGELTWLRLVIAIVVATSAFEVLGATAEALMAIAGQRYVMTGRLSALAEFAEIVPGVIALLLGGWMASNVSPRNSIIIAGLITGAVMVQALWRPVAVFAPPVQAEENENHLQALRRLMRDKSLRPAGAVLFLWNFSPGFGTPLLFFLSDHVKVSTEGFGAYRAVTLASGAVAALLYALLCRRVSLRRILWWTLALNVLPGFLLLFAHSTVQALAIGAIIGLLLGLVNIAVFDLLRRSCPPSLEGSGMMLGYSVFALGGTLGDLLGAYLYERGGFLICLVLDAIATAATLLVLARIPRSVLSSRDGEPSVHVPQQALALK